MCAVVLAPISTVVTSGLVITQAIANWTIGIPISSDFLRNISTVLKFLSEKYKLMCPGAIPNRVVVGTLDRSELYFPARKPAPSGL